MPSGEFAFRSDSSDHQLCRSWLDRVVNGDERYGLSPLVLAGFPRVTTHDVNSPAHGVSRLAGRLAMKAPRDLPPY